MVACATSSFLSHVIAMRFDIFLGNRKCKKPICKTNFFLYKQTNNSIKPKWVCGHTYLGIPMSLWSHQICRSSWPTPSSCRWPKGSDASCTSSCQSTAKKCAKSIGPGPFCIPFWSARRVQLCSMVTWSSPNKYMALITFTKTSQLKISSGTWHPA